MGPGTCCGRKSIGEVWAGANSALAETQLDLVCLERTIKIFYFKFYSLVCKGQINLQSGKKWRNYCFPIEIPLMYRICILLFMKKFSSSLKIHSRGNGELHFLLFVTTLVL